MVDQIEYTSSGLTANLGRTTDFVRLSGQQVPLIDNLRLEVKYHDNNMLQFKVNPFVKCYSWSFWKQIDDFVIISKQFDSGYLVRSCQTI